MDPQFVDTAICFISAPQAAAPGGQMARRHEASARPRKLSASYNKTILV